MISFIPISSPATEEDIHFLHKLLLSRQFNISNLKSPSIEDHRAFVLNHPYRNWSLVLRGNTSIGSVYSGFDNSVGITLFPEFLLYRRSVIKKFLEDFAPLPGRASIVRDEFIFNVAIGDLKYQEDLLNCGAIQIQHTYTIKKINPTL